MHLWNRCIVIKFFFFIESILLKAQMSHEFYMSLWRQSLSEIIDDYRRWKDSDDKNSLLLNFLSQSMFMNIHMTKLDDKLRAVMNKNADRLNVIALNSYFRI